MEKKIKRLLPRKKRDKGASQVQKVKSLLFSFALGNDSLSDLDDLRDDILFRELIGKEVAARTMGDFLKNFGTRHVDKLQDYLIEMANAFDQYGFSYLFDLRPGNTFSGKDAEQWIHKIFSKTPKRLERWFRADSAYGSFKIFEALQAKNVKFSIVLRENLARYVRTKNANLLKWKKTKLQFFYSRACEVAMGHYPVKQLGELRVVFLRAPKEDAQLNLLEDSYRYYSIVTNIDASKMTEEDVLDFYRQRATAENYIKEQKYGYDFLNFPCQKLKANKVFGIIGTLAHNMGKDGKIKTVEQLGYFAKHVRNKLIKIACRVVRSARRIKLRLNRHNKEVLEKVCEKLRKILSQQYVQDP